MSRSADELVGWFEVDWIELTGVEELLLGELAPPSVEYFHFEGDGLFAPPVFSPIMPELMHPRRNAAVLTDLDGDGDLDLFSTWRDVHFASADPFVSGWVMALNDGSGAFETARHREGNRRRDRLSARRRFDRRWPRRDRDKKRLGNNGLVYWARAANGGAHADQWSLAGGHSGWRWRRPGRTVYNRLYSRGSNSVRGLGGRAGGVDSHPVGGHRKLFSLSAGRLYRRWRVGRAVGAERRGQVAGSGLGRRAGGGRGRL